MKRFSQIRGNHERGFYQQYNYEIYISINSKQQKPNTPVEPETKLNYTLGHGKLGQLILGKSSS